MNKIIISKETDICYNLALEQQLSELVGEETILYLWRNQACVVLGRNQNPYLECDLEYLKRKKIQVARRNSGGGAVYQDLGNLNYTFLNRCGMGEPEKQGAMLLRTLKDLGADACFSGRNDILAGGRKISGQAVFCGERGEYLHGTLLVKVDFERMSRALQPSKLKLESKGVSSVRNRVVNLCEFVPEIQMETVIGELERQFISFFGPVEPMCFFSEDTHPLPQKSRYSSKDWTLYNCPGFTAWIDFKDEQGVLRLGFEVADGRITAVHSSSDSLGLPDTGWIQDCFVGTKFCEPEILEKMKVRGGKYGCL